MDEKTYNTVWSEKLSGNFRSGRAKIVSQLLPSLTGNRLLDVGCGNGETGKYFSTRFQEIHGTDISDTALQAAVENGVITQKVNLNNESLPYSNHFFDMVTCLDVIEHVFDTNNLLSEICRVIKPGGTFVLSYPNIGFIKFRLSLLTGSFPLTSDDPEPYDGGHIHYWTVRDMCKLLRGHTFTPVSFGATGRLAYIKRFFPNLLARNPFIVSQKNNH